MPITGVIYDHDGTLVNSLKVVVAATNQALAAHGFPLDRPEAIIAAMIYPTTPRMGHHSGVQDLAQQRVLADAFYVAARAIGHRQARVYDGVHAAVERLAGRGIPQGVVSNNDGEFVRIVMRGLGLAPFFVALYGEDDVPAPKPDPRGILQAAAAMQRAPGNCIYVGDSGGDAEAGHAAGMRTVGVTWGIHSASEVRAMGFDWVIDRADELDAIVAGTTSAGR